LADSIPGGRSGESDADPARRQADRDAHRGRGAPADEDAIDLRDQNRIVELVEPDGAGERLTEGQAGVDELPSVRRGQHHLGADRHLHRAGLAVEHGQVALGERRGGGEGDQARAQGPDLALDTGGDRPGRLPPLGGQFLTPGVGEMSGDEEGDQPGGNEQAEDEDEQVAPDPAPARPPRRRRRIRRPPPDRHPGPPDAADPAAIHVRRAPHDVPAYGHG
jgi:hypothetical protein